MSFPSFPTEPSGDNRQGIRPSLRGRAILFDMDGTLVDSSAIIHRAWRWWTAKHSIPLAPVLAVEKGRPNRDVLRQFGPHLDLDQEAVSFLAFEESDTQDLVEIAGAREAVRAAQNGHWAIVTSATRRLAEIRLQATCLPLPDVFITSDLISRGKPDPECFLLAAERLGVDPRDCIVFEDAPAGIEAGVAAGMQVIGVASTPSHPNLSAPLRIRDFRQVSITSDATGWFELQFSPDASL